MDSTSNAGLTVIDFTYFDKRIAILARRLDVKKADRLKKPVTPIALAIQLGFYCDFASATSVLIGDDLSIAYAVMANVSPSTTIIITVEGPREEYFQKVLAASEDFGRGRQQPNNMPNGVALVCYNSADELEKNLKEMMAKKSILSFDIAVMNPPYLDGLHMKFLYMVAGCTKQIALIAPATDFIKQGEGRQDAELSKIFPRLKAIRLVNAQSVFPSIELGVPLAVTYFEPDTQPFVRFELDANVAEVTSLDQISIHSFKPGYEAFKTEILAAAKASPIIDEFLWSSNKKSSLSYKITDEEWFIEGNGVVGHATDDRVNTSVDNILQPDATVFFVDSNRGPIKKDQLVGSKHKYAWGAKTKLEIDSKFSYAKTNFARAALSIYRYGTGLGRRHLISVPAVPWDRIWDDEQLIKHFNLSSEAQQYLASIPKYHEKDRAQVK